MGEKSDTNSSLSIIFNPHNNSMRQHRKYLYDIIVTTIDTGIDIDVDVDIWHFS